MYYHLRSKFQNPLTGALWLVKTVITRKIFDGSKGTPMVSTPHSFSFVPPLVHF